MARSRTSVERKRYSAASPASRRPTTLSDAFMTIAGSTSRADCWAPMRSTPRLRPRAAMSTRTSLMGLDPSRGAYLFSSSRTMNRSGSRPIPCFSSKIRVTSAPTTKRWAASWSACRSTTVTGSSSATSASPVLMRWPRRGELANSRRRKAIAVLGWTLPVQLGSECGSSGLSFSVRKSTRSAKSRMGVPSPAGRADRCSVTTRAKLYEVPGAGSHNTTAPGSFSSGCAHRASWTRTRCSTNEICVRTSSSSAKQKRSNPCAMKAAGDQPKARTSVEGREATSVTFEPG